MSGAAPVVQAGTARAECRPMTITDARTDGIRQQHCTVKISCSRLSVGCNLQSAMVAKGTPCPRSGIISKGYYESNPYY